MARKLSRIARIGSLTSVALMALSTIAFAQPSLGVQSSPAVEEIPNPYFSGNQRPGAQAPPPVPEMPEHGPRTYQNPWADVAAAPQSYPRIRYQRRIMMLAEQAASTLPDAAAAAAAAGTTQRTAATRRIGLQQPLDLVPATQIPADQAEEVTPAENDLITQELAASVGPIQFGEDIQDRMSRPKLLPQVASDGPSRVIPTTTTFRADVLPEPLQQATQPPFEPIQFEPIEEGREPRRFEPIELDGAVKEFEPAAEESPPKTTSAVILAEPRGAADLAYAMFEEAQHLAEDATSLGQISSVVRVCRQGLESSPSGELARSLRMLAAWAYNRRGELHAGAGRQPMAMSDFQAAIRVDPECWLALHNRAIAYAREEKPFAALRDFNHVLEINPSLTTAYRDRGELLAWLGRTEEAIDDYSRALVQTPGDAELYSLRGQAQHRLGRYDQALENMNRSLTLSPNQADVYTQRGNLQAERGDYAAAVQDYREALEIDRTSADAYRCIAWLLSTCPDPRYRDPERALAAAERAIELADSRDCFMFDTLAAAHASAGQFEEAIYFARQAMASAPGVYTGQLQQRLSLYEGRRPFQTGNIGQIHTVSHEEIGTHRAQ